MNPPDSAASEPTSPDIAVPAPPAAFALALARRYVMPPLVLSLMVSIAAVTSLLTLAVPLEGELGEALNPWFERFLGNAFSATIVVVFLAAAIYAALQLVGVALDRDRLRLLDATPAAVPSSWLALLSGRSFRPDVGADDGETIIFDDAYDTAERYGLQRRRYVEQGLTPLRFVVWVLPLLGFIGTVVGIARSITGLESVIGAGGGGQTTAGLATVLDGLRFAFDTTLLGLATVIPVMALLMTLERREDSLTGQGRDRVQALLAAPGKTDIEDGRGAVVPALERAPSRNGGLET